MKNDDLRNVFLIIYLPLASMRGFARENPGKTLLVSVMLQAGLVVASVVKASFVNKWVSNKKYFFAIKYYKDYQVQRTNCLAL